MNPTYVIMVGPFGASVAARVRAALAKEPALAVLAYLPVPEPTGRDATAPLLAAFAKRAVADLHGLLRGTATRADSTGGSRLDLVIVADLAEAGSLLLVEVLQTLSTILRSEFAVMFPPDIAAEQRNVWLVMILATAALDDTPAGRQMRAGLMALESWHFSGPPSPLLNRIFVLPDQNEGMPLARSDLESGVYLLLAILYLSGLRETDAVRSRLGPPRSPRYLLATFAIAAIEVDVDRVLSAFAWRSALTGLQQLAAQCEAVPSPERVSAVADELALELFCSELVALGQGQGQGQGKSDASLHLRLEAAARSEAAALRQARRVVRELAEGHLAGNEGLTGWPLLFKSLALAREQLVRSSEELAPGWLPDRQPDPPTALAPAPRPAARSGAELSAKALLARGSLLGLVVGAVVAACVSVHAAHSVASPGGGGPTMTAGLAAPDPGAVRWGTSGAALIAALWLAAASWSQWRRRDQAAATSEKTPPTRSARGLSPTDARTLNAALALRKRRIARGILRLIDDQLARLEGLRAAVHEALTHSHESLRTLGVKPREQPPQDDYSLLWPADTPLHRGLLPPSVLPRLWERNRALRDDKLWASELLQRAWPAGGIDEDLPFGSGQPWEAALWQQHQALRDKGVFAWPDLDPVLPEQLGHFLRTVPPALKFGVRSRRPDGSPHPLSHADELLVAVPPDGRATVERLLRELALPDAQVLSSTPELSCVLILRTAGEFDVASLEPHRS